MRAGLLFEGIGGFGLALQSAGVDIAWHAEIDPDCCRVLERHFPGVPNLGDVREIGTAGAVPGVDLFCGGFPCQDLSVAGRRAGLAGERSGLFWEFHRLAALLRPRWLLLENVPGLLSSCGCPGCRKPQAADALWDDEESIARLVKPDHRGRDMATVLHALAGLGYGWAYRVLDARHWGVAQRRRRVFIVGCLGDPARAAQVLFEPESCPRNPPASRAARPRVAASLTSGAHGPGVSGPGRHGEDDVNLVVGALRASDGGPDDNLAQSGHVLAAVAATLNSGGNAGGFRTEPGEHLVLARSLTAHHQRLDAGQCGGSNVTSGVPFVLQDTRGDDKAQNGSGVTEGDTAYTLDSTGAQGVAYRKAQKPHGPDDCERWEETGVAGTLAGHSTTTAEAVVSAMQVRRLTPRECERLQGFPDDHTAFGPAAEPISDSARYRTIGNAVAVPVVAWAARRLVAVDEGRNPNEANP